MNPWALFLYLILGVVEFFVIQRALREWLGMRGWAVAIMAAIASYVPLVGGIVACVGAITVLEWAWWLAGGIFIGGTAALALTGGVSALWGQFSLF